MAGKTQRIYGPASQHARGAQPQQLTQLVEFEGLFCALAHGSFSLRISAASRGVRAQWISRPAASPQSPGWPSSTSRTRSTIGIQNSPSATRGLPQITDLLAISQATASS